MPLLLLAILLKAMRDNPQILLCLARPFPPIIHQPLDHSPNPVLRGTHQLIQRLDMRHLGLQHVKLC